MAKGIFRGCQRVFCDMAAVLFLAGAAQSEPSGQTSARTEVAGNQPILIELSILACKRDVNCRNFSLLYDAYHVSLLTCMIAGQREIAAWSARHPLYVVRRWSCGFPQLADQRA